MELVDNRGVSSVSLANIGRGDRYRGAIDRVDARAIVGWALDGQNSDVPLEIDIFFGSYHVTTTQASIFRESLRDRMGTSGEHEFRIEWRKLHKKIKSSLVVALNTLVDAGDQPISIRAAIHNTSFDVSHQRLQIKQHVMPKPTELLASILRKSDDEAQGAPVGQFEMTPEQPEPTPAQESAAAPKVRAIAFYLPQYHPIPENDRWWGKGFTEWTNVTRAQPQMKGHHQPRRPTDLGYYDLRLAEIREQQAQLAQRYGIHGFCYYYYWFAGKRLLERPLDDMLSSGTPDFPFCLCWANESWSRRWDGSETDVLMKQEHSPELDVAFAESVVPYLLDKRYIKVNGHPVLLVYRPDIIPDLTSTIQRWRKIFRDRGVGEVHLVAALTFGFEAGIENGFDAEVQFPPHGLKLTARTSNYETAPDFEGTIYSYPEAVQTQISHHAPGKVRYFTTMLQWDNTARKKNKSHVYADFTLDLYEEWTAASVRKTLDFYPHDHNLVFINAWNEWAEGTYLEPDATYGHSPLQATMRALLEQSGPKPQLRVQTLAQLPHIDTKQVAARLSDALILAARDPEVTININTFVPKPAVYVTKTAYSSQEQTLLWLEAPTVGQRIESGVLHLSGWVISKTDRPMVVEVTINGRLSKQERITGLRKDVFDYHADYNAIVCNNAFHIQLAAIDCLADLKASINQIHLSIIGTNATPLASCFITLNAEQSAITKEALIDELPSSAKDIYDNILTTKLKSAPVLFVIHDPYPAGAQLFILRYLERLVADDYHLPVSILFAISQTQLGVYGRNALNIVHRAERIGHVYFLNEDGTLPAPIFDTFAFSLIYINSIASLRNAAIIELARSKAVIHVHEMAHTINSLVEADVVQSAYANGATFIACSDAVTNALRDSFGIPHHAIRTIHAFASAKSPTCGDEAVAEVRNQLGLKAGEQVILLVGTLNWRKGKHLLAPIAVELKKRLSEMPRFIWVGDEGYAGAKSELSYEFAQAGLSEALIITGYRTDVACFYALADVFLLASVEDPFPLVMLEAGLANTPVIGFAESGGVAEFAQAGGGRAVPFLDVVAMADAIVEALGMPRTASGSDAAYQFTDCALAGVLTNHIESLRIYHAS